MSIKKILSLVFILILSSQAKAQFNLSGVLKDTLDLKGVPFASVSLIKQSDSVLHAFTRSDASGNFSFQNLPSDHYILLIVQNKYLDYLEKVNLDATKKLGTIALTQKGKFLQEVTITAKNAVVMRGDTLEYLADSFKVRQGAVVEDLIKALPGMSVDKDGKITSQGQQVQKVLVDGEEFFGDDPTVATRNLQARVVEKVQVFDQKSDQAAFTGFDDGQETKTINLKLKENMNKGFFGKAEAGGGWEDRWNNQLMANWFEGKRQVSLYGLMNSNGQSGLSWEDNMKFGNGGNQRMFGGDDEDGAVIVSFFEDDDEDEGIGGFGRNANNPGINKAWNVGARYANKLDDDKHHITANYSNTKLYRELRKQDYTETILPSQSIYRIDSSESFTNRNINKLSARYEWKPDSNNALIYNLSGRLVFKDVLSQLGTINKLYDETPFSSNLRNSKENNITTKIVNSLTYNRKLGKKGRTLSLFGSQTYNRKTGDNFINSVNSLGQSGVGLQILTDQKRIDNSSNNSYIGTISYTESIVENILMKLAYGISSDNADLALDTYDELDSIVYMPRIDSLSNEFDMHILRNSGTLEFLYNKKKWNVRVGSSVAYSQFNQLDKIRNVNYDYNRWNVFPSFRLRYKFSQFKRIDFNYNGSTTNPTAQQLQPIQNNINPLELYIGNPELKIGYSQNVTLNYFTFNALSYKGMWTGIMFNHASNPVGLNRNFDALGRTINQYINLDNRINTSAWLGGMKRFGSKGWEGRMNVSGSYNLTPTVVNSVQSKTTNYGANFTPSISYNNEEKMFFSIDPGFSYSFSQNQVNRNRNIQFWSLEPSLSFAYYFKHDYEFGTDIDWTYQPAVSPYPDAFNRTLWDAYVSKRILPKKNLELRFQVWDILNQNKGYNRVSANNYNTESFFTNLQRYWMVSAVWNFFSGPVAETQAGNGMGGNRKQMRRYYRSRH